MCRSITCVILTVFNIALLLAGLALLIAGALLKWNKQLLNQIINTALEKAGANMGSFDRDALDQALARIQEMSGPIGNVAFIMGIVLCGIAVVAFVGLCCNIRLVMIIYAILVGAVLLAHLLLVIIYFAKKDVLMKYVDKVFVDMVKKYKSMTTPEAESVALSLLMPAMKCCGYNNGDDFNDSSFTRNDSYNGRPFTGIQYPLPCCDFSKIKGNQDDCPLMFTDQNSFKDVGCKDKIIPLIDMIMKYSLIALAVEAAVLIITAIHLCLM